MNSHSTHTAIAWVALFLMLGAALPGLLMAKEATKRGRNATIVWVDEEGAQHETRGGEIRYGYFTRAHLSVPKDGRNYRDDEHQINALSFVDSYIKFSKLARLDFAYETIAENASPRLTIKITPLRGKPTTRPGNAITGSEHPASPFIAFQVDGVERRIELNPLGGDKNGAGRMRILSADFKI